MTRHIRSSILGVTLLEIMLVLAIAAMIILMSVRYYNTATTSSYANAALESIQAMAAAADSISESSGTYLSANTSNIAGSIGPAATFPWGGGAGAITMSNSTTSYVVTIASMPYAVCNMVKAKLRVNSHFSTGTTCPTSGTVPFSYSYTQ